ncbi:hypothetical protein ACWGRV_03275 [Streptomyces sp. NPDC055663]
MRQNSGQLSARYDPYALRWDKEEALRLALRVTAHADALPVPATESQTTELSYDEIVETLFPAWGWKMGTEKSEEARSHLRVPSALGDFNDQVQARDVVVFLSEAAQLSIPRTTREDRVLVIESCRGRQARGAGPIMLWGLWRKSHGTPHHGRGRAPHHGGDPSRAGHHAAGRRGDR